MKYNKDTPTIQQPAVDTDDDLSLMPERDELLAHNSGGQSADTPLDVDTADDRIAPPINTTSSHKPRSFGFSSVLLWLLVLSLGGFCGWQFLEIQKLQSNLANNSTQAISQINQLQSKLSASDQETSLSTSSLQDKVKDNSSEIRKLWAIANDKNRKNIESHDKRLTEQSAQINTNQKQVDETKNRIEALSADLKTTQAKIPNIDLKLIDQLANDIAQSDKQLKALEEKLAQNIKQQTQLQTKFNTLDKKDKQIDSDLTSYKQTTDIQIGTVQEQLDQLGSGNNIAKQINNRVTNNEEAITSIDKGRAKTSKDLISLKQQLNNYKRTLDSHKADIAKLKQSVGLQ